jgi:hypothetical protein
MRISLAKKKKSNVKLAFDKKDFMGSLTKQSRLSACVTAQAGDQYLFETTETH